MRFHKLITIACLLIAAVLMAILTVMTHVFLRDGPPPGYTPMQMALLLGMFWIFALGAAGYAFGKPGGNIGKDPAGAGLSLLTPWGRFRCACRPEDVRHAGIHESENSEGVPRFIARVALEDGRIFNLAEGATRDACETALRGFLANMGCASPQPAPECPER